jgi:hypothetical protein
LQALIRAFKERGDLFFDEGAQDAAFDFVQNDVHRG